jgi:hypothetical protein
MAGTQTYINPALPSSVASRQTPPPGVRAELITRTTAPNLWTVPTGVYYAKVTIVGGSGGNFSISNPGGTTSFDTIATATGGLNDNTCCGAVCASSNGVFTVSTTRLTQQVGVSYSATATYIKSPYGQSTGSGGQGTFYLENLVPGTVFRVTIGAGASGASQSGCCLIEY